MAKPKVFLTRELPSPVMAFLKEHTELSYNAEDRVLKKREIIEGVQGKEGLISLVTDTIDREVIEAASDLKVISNYAVGFNNIDVQAATEHNIAVTNTPGVLTETTADLAWALLMAVARRVVEGDVYTRSGKWENWAPQLFLGSDVHGATLGIVGMGRIGQAVARRARGFEMNVLYYSRTRLPQEQEQRLNAEYVTIGELLERADYISIHVPYTESTHHLIGEGELKQMKKTAYLINTARGPIVDEKALVHALEHGVIAGAGLDVYEREPQLEPGLKDLSNVVLLPHIGSASVKTRTNMGMMAAQNALDVLTGRPCENVVNQGGLNHVSNRRIKAR